MPEPDRPAAVVTALAEELGPILRRLDFSTQRLDGRRVFRAQARGRTVILTVTGDGSSNAARRTARLCEVYGPTALLGLGVAGALTSGLAPFDLVASAHLRDGSGEAPAPDAVLLARATQAGARAATLVTASAPVLSPAGRKALAPPLDSEVAAVDMESAGWARGAAGARVPFVVVRAISDGAGEELPAYLAACVGPDGGIARMAVVRRALLSPSSIPALIRMRNRVARCGERLAGFFLKDFVFP